MRLLLHELGQAIKLAPLEVRTRWHAARLARLDRLAAAHRAAFDACVDDVRAFAEAR